MLLNYQAESLAKTRIFCKEQGVLVILWLATRCLGSGGGITQEAQQINTPILHRICLGENDTAETVEEGNAQHVPDRWIHVCKCSLVSHESVSSRQNKLCMI